MHASKAKNGVSADPFSPFMDRRHAVDRDVEFGLFGVFLYLYDFGAAVTAIPETAGAVRVVFSGCRYADFLYGSAHLAPCDADGSPDDPSAV